MKRLLVLLISLALLCACQPTPEKEYVVNKSDDTLEQKLSASAIPVPDRTDTVIPQTSVPTEAAAEQSASPVTGSPVEPTEPPAKPQGQAFPAHWNDTIVISDTLTVTVDADVVTRADGVYPVYRTKDGIFTETEVLSILHALLPKPQKRLSGAVTKETVAGQIENFNEQAELWQAWRAKGSPEDDRPDGEELTDAEIAIVLDEYAEQLRLAPERDEEQAVTDFTLGQIRSVYELEDGRTATVVLQDRTLHFCIGGGNLYMQWEYERDLAAPAGAEHNVNAWIPVTLTRADAENILWDALDQIGYEGFAIASAQAANMYCDNGRASESSGWLFVLGRDYGGYPLELQAKADGRIQYAEGDDVPMNAPVTAESLTVMVTEDGVVSFTHGGLKRIVRSVNENVELLPFDEVRERAINGLRFAFTGYGGSDRYQGSFTVFKAVLTTYTLRIRNEDEYYEMPCWLLLFDHTLSDAADYTSDSADRHYRALVINAVDGSIVNPKLGY